MRARPALKRGFCPVCGRIVSLRAYTLSVRAHTADGRRGSLRCEGSGQDPRDDKAWGGAP